MTPLSSILKKITLPHQPKNHFSITYTISTHFENLVIKKDGWFFDLERDERKDTYNGTITLLTRVWFCIRLLFKNNTHNFLHDVKSVSMSLIYEIL